MHTKADENRCRRRAERRGYRLKKTKRHDRLAIDYNMFALIDQETGDIVLVTKSLERIEMYLDQPRP